MERRVRTADQLRRTDAAAALQGGIWEIESSQNTFTDGQGNKYWLIDTTGGAVSVALPAAADVSPDTIFNVKRTTGGANALTVTPDSGNIDGSAAHSIATQYAAFGYASDGTNYHIVRQYSPGEFITSASLATSLAPYLTSASAALSTYLTSSSAATALATKQGLIAFADEGTTLSTAGSVATVSFVGSGFSASLTGGLLTLTSSGGATLDTEQATTSGTTKDFTIPAGAKRIIVMLNGVSTNSSTALLGIQLGDSGGIEATGYISRAVVTKDAAASVGLNITTRFGIVVESGSASIAYSGHVILTRVNASHLWVCSAVISTDNATLAVAHTAGNKTLSAELTTVRLMNSTGATFDAGSVNVLYE